MKRIMLAAACFGLVGCADVMASADDQPVTTDRIETALGKIGVRPIMAGCIAPRLMEKLDAQRVRDLERLGEEVGVEPGSLSDGKAMAGLRRLDDRETAKAVISIAGGCGFDLMMQRN